jgi:hypothetical protein
MPDPFTVAGLFTQPVYTVATLPAAAPWQGALRLVTDAASSPWTDHGKVATGGGTYRSRVISDGTVWRLHY